MRTSRPRARSARLSTAISRFAARSSTAVAMSVSVEEAVEVNAWLTKIIFRSCDHAPSSYWLDESPRGAKRWSRHFGMKLALEMDGGAPIYAQNLFDSCGFAAHHRDADGVRNHPP